MGGQGAEAELKLSSAIESYVNTEVQNIKMLDLVLKQSGGWASA
jgi:hypothetical protein